MKRILFGLLSVFLMDLMIGCNEYDESGLDADLQRSGNVIIKITDAPFPADMVAEANITIDWIKLLTSDEEVSEEDDEGNGNGNDDGNGEDGEEKDTSSILIELDEAITINLLDLSNGKTRILTEADVPEGIYKEIRLHVIAAGIMLEDSATFDLKVPSGDASGLKIKINPALNVEKETISEVLLDFDVSRSFVLRGNMKHGYDKVVGFIFKPVVRAVVSLESSEISGVVSATDTLIENASLALLSGGDTVTTALTDDKGYYSMIGILSGEYSLACEAGGYQKQVKELEIGIGESKEQNFELEEEKTEGSD